MAFAGMLCLWASPTGAEAVMLQLGLEAENLLDPQQLVGEWFAMVEEKTYPQPVYLRIGRVKPGKTAAKMTYASPRRCVVDLEYGGPHEGRHIFYIIRFTTCFEYGKSDFVAISQAPPEADGDATEERGEVAGGAGGPAEAGETRDVAVGETASLPEGFDERMDDGKVDRILYAVNLGGIERESAIMTRQ
ncbi:MAG: hypothetical protein ACE5KF_07085 [Kiloniellaceae bacterium]